MIVSRILFVSVGLVFLWLQSVVYAGQLKLTWADNANNEDGFKIERRLQGGSFAPLVTLAANSITYTDTTLVDSSTYCYRLAAFNTAGTSAFSNEACGTAASPSPPPSTDTVLSATLRMLNGNPAIDFGCTNLGSGWTYGLEIQGADSVWSSVNVSPPFACPSYTIGGANYGTTYTFRLKAVSATETRTSGALEIPIPLAGSSLPTTTFTSGVSSSSPPPSPSDTTSPAVSITAPLGGVTVSGTSVTITANASDDIGVVGVQFKLNGSNFGVEDTTSPFSVSWDTTTISDGSHVITAVARDAAGNTATSSSVTVTVQNTIPSSPPPSTDYVITATLGVSGSSPAIFLVCPNLGSGWTYELDLQGSTGSWQENILPAIFTCAAPTPYMIGGANYDTTYTFRVRAISALETRMSGLLVIPIPASTDPLPSIVFSSGAVSSLPPPVGVVLSATLSIISGNPAISFFCADLGSGWTYGLEIQGADGTWSKVNVVPAFVCADPTPYVIGGANYSTTYIFRLRVVSGADIITSGPLVIPIPSSSEPLPTTIFSSGS